MQADAETLHFRVQPFIRTRKSRWPLTKICNEIDFHLSRGTDIREDSLNFRMSIELGHYLIYRQNWQVKALLLSEYQAILFECLQSGSSLVDSCITLERYLENSSVTEMPSIHEWLGDWVNLEIFCQL